jgi:CRP-like cAMP-binding protein
MKAREFFEPAQPQLLTVTAGTFGLTNGDVIFAIYQFGDKLIAAPGRLTVEAITDGELKAESLGGVDPYRLNAILLLERAKLLNRAFYHRLDMRGRLLAALKELARDGEIHGLSHQVLAQFIGTTREVVCTHLNALRKEGVIEYSRGVIKLLAQEGR